MIKECKRILKPNGKLIIGEFVFKKNKFSYKYCPKLGGRYKSEINFINDIVNIGYKCDTVLKKFSTYRIFIFRKKN